MLKIPSQTLLLNDELLVKRAVTERSHFFTKVVEVLFGLLP